MGLSAHLEQNWEEASSGQHPAHPLSIFRKLLSNLPSLPDTQPQCPTVSLWKEARSFCIQLHKSSGFLHFFGLIFSWGIYSFNSRFGSISFDFFFFFPEHRPSLKILELLHWNLSNSPHSFSSELALSLQVTQTLTTVLSEWGEKITLLLFLWQILLISWCWDAGMASQPVFPKENQSPLFLRLLFSLFLTTTDFLLCLLLLFLLLLSC